MAGTLEARGVAKRFGELEVLAGVDFVITGGEFVAIVGPSGCGKTTLLKIASGLDCASSGTMHWQGQRIALSAKNGEIGYISQRPVLLPWRSVRENISLSVELLPQRNASRMSAIEVIHDVKLDDFQDYLPSKLSGGMKQRVALGRLLMHRPSLVLMDEPFSELDEKTREDMAQLTLDICRRLRSTALFVTHQLSEAIIMADRILVFSARPARVIADIKVDLPRPRNSEVQGSDSYIEIQTCLRRLLGFTN